MICTITPIVNRKQAASYYSRDDYYSKDAKKNDYWQGNFAKDIGLDGLSVDKKHINEFIKMVSERSNIGEGKSPTLACDITFSVPKSISLLQAVSPHYRQIVNKCLEETTNEMIALIEKNYIRTRRGKSGKILEYTHNFIAAGINHEVNRNDELDRHVHLFIPNITKTKDGKLLTIDIRYLMKQQKLFGAISRSKLAAKLQREGIEIEVDDPQHGFYHIKGINRDIEEKFSSRMAEILTEKDKFESVSAKDIQSIILKTRKAKNHKVDIDKVFADTSQFLQNAGVKIIPAENKSPDIKQKKAIFDVVLRDIEMKHFSFSRNDIIQQVLNAGLSAQIQLDDVNKFINQCKKLRKTTDKNGNEFFISKANEKCENDLLELLNRAKGNGKCIDSLSADRLLLKIINEKKLTPNEEQKNAILTCITSKNAYVAIQGLAGVGKTYFVSILREMCNRSNIPVRGAAFAGAASDELANDSGIVNCNTIDSLLLHFEKESLKNQGKPFFTDVKFGYKRDYNFYGLQKDKDGGFLVVDEFGMVDDIHARALMQLCEAKGWKFIAIGDYDQIPAINVGDPHRFLINHGATTCYLQNINRQRENLELLKIVKESVLGSVDNAFRLLNNSTISKIADKIIHSMKDNIAKIFIKTDSQEMSDEINSEVHKRIGIFDNKVFASNDDFIIKQAQNLNCSIDVVHSGIREIKDKEQRINAAVDEYFNAFKTYNQEQIAVATLSNSERIDINNKIHQRFIDSKSLLDDIPFQVSNGDLINPQSHNINISVGERIICLKNDKKVGVRNGTKGNIININGRNITLKTDSGKIVSFNANEYNTFDFAYALTINKLQGATVQKIICNADSKFHMDRNKFYVTVSRAKSDVTILTDDIDKLNENARQWCHKATSDDFINYLQNQIDENHSRIIGSDYKNKFQRAAELRQRANLCPAVTIERNRFREEHGNITFNNMPSFLYPISSQPSKEVKEVMNISSPASTPQISNNPVIPAQKPKSKKIHKVVNKGFSR